MIRDGAPADNASGAEVGDRRRQPMGRVRRSVGAARSRRLPGLSSVWTKEPPGLRAEPEVAAGGDQRARHRASPPGVKIPMMAASPVPQETAWAARSLAVARTSRASAMRTGSAPLPRSCPAQSSRPVGTGIRKTSPQPRQRVRFPARDPSTSNRFLHPGQFRTICIRAPWVPPVDEERGSYDAKTRVIDRFGSLILPQYRKKSTDIIRKVNGAWRSIRS